MNIYETARPFYYITKITGFACFSIDGDIKNGRIKTKLIDLLLLLFHFVCHSTTCILNIIKEFDRTKSQSGFVDFGNKLQFTFSTINISFYMLVSYIQRHNIWSILHHLHIFDENIKALGYSVNHNKHKLFFWPYVVSLVVYAIIGISLLIFSSNYAMISIAYSVIYSFLQLGIIQLSILSVYTRQNDFIKCFRKYFLSNKNSIRYVKSKNMSLVMIFSKLHGNLNLAIASINKSFSLTLFVGLAIYFTHTVYSIYRDIQAYKNSTSESFNIILVQLRIRLLLIIFTIYVFIIFLTSNEITRRV